LIFRPKKSVGTANIYLALPPDNMKTGKQDGPPTLIRLNSNGADKFKGKFPTPIERFIQRVQNYFSVYNPPEYLNDLQRPGINNPENDDDDGQTDYSNETQIILPCNGTSTIVIIPVPLEGDHVSGDQHANAPDKLDGYGAPKPDYAGDATAPNRPEAPCAQQTTTPRSKCPEPTTPRPKCPEPTTPRPKCPEATTPRPDCPGDATTPSTNRPEAPCAQETTTPRPKCPEPTTTRLKCPEPTTPKPECPEPTTPNVKCSEAATQKSPCPTKQTTNSPRPISGYGHHDVPPLNLVAQPVLGSTVVYFYKYPSTPPPSHPPSYYIIPPSTPTPQDEHTGRPKPPALRLKQLLFPRLYAAFHPDD